MKAATLTVRALRLLPLAAIFAAGGCFATRNDVRVVQTDIASMRTELLKAHADEQASLTQALRTVSIANDSVKAMSNRLTSVQGDVRGGLRNVNEQLITVQELLRQSASSIDRLRAKNEALFNQPAPLPPTGGIGGVALVTDSAMAHPMSQPTTGPAQLYEAGTRNLNGGSVSTARSAFQELLTNFPNSDLAPQAQLGIAQSYQNEKRFDAALPAYGAVISKYPESSAAPTALYKSARILVDQGKNADAKVLLTQLVTKYRGSDEFDLATDLLKTLR